MNKTLSVHSTLTAFGFAAAATFLSSSAARAESTGCEVKNILGQIVGEYAAVPGTTPISCHAGRSSVTYTGVTKDGIAIFERCAWTLDEKGSPVVDPSYHEIDSRNDTAHDARRLQFSDGKLIATQGTNLYGQSETISANLEAFDASGQNLGTKNCNVGADTEPLHDCKDVKPFVTQNSLATDQHVADNCKGYVNMLAKGGAITTEYYDRTESDKKVWKKLVSARIADLSK